MALELDVVWSERDGGWFTRVPSRPGEWVRVHSHHDRSASGLALTEAVRGMLLPADARRASIRRLPPAIDGLPKESTGT